MQAARCAFDETTQHRRTVPEFTPFLKMLFSICFELQKEDPGSQIMAFAVNYCSQSPPQYSRVRTYVAVKAIIPPS